MTITMSGGWLSGSLPDDTGREWPVTQSRQTPTGAQHGSPVNLVMHTTETDSLVGSLQYPSNFQCGEGKIVQHIELGYSGDAVFTYDRDNIGIEMVGRSNLGLWLPAESTLGPTVALVAWLHSSGRIKTGIKRPTADWPTVLDTRGTVIATTAYYRRHTGLFPATPGVYGHVEIPDNSHWDPGSFNYPVFFNRVQQVLQGGDMTPAETAELKRVGNYVDELIARLGAANAVGAADRVAKATQTVEAGLTPTTGTGAITVSQGDQRYALHEHGHTGSVSVT